MAVSWWFAGSVACALLAGALLPRAPGRGLDRLRPAVAPPEVMERGDARKATGARWARVRPRSGLPGADG